jgi:hypothetical protein
MKSRGERVLNPHLLPDVQNVDTHKEVFSKSKPHNALAAFHSPLVSVSSPYSPCLLHVFWLDHDDSGIDPCDIGSSFRPVGDEAEALAAMSISAITCPASQQRVDQLH